MSEPGDNETVLAGADGSVIEELDATDEVVVPRELDDGVKLTDSQKMDSQRYTLATVLLWMTLGLALAILVLASVTSDQTWSRIDRVVALVFVPFTTLLGTAMGWYFGGGGRPGNNP